MSGDPLFPLLADLSPADHDALGASCSRRALRRGEALGPRADAEGAVLFVRRGLMRTSADDAEGDGVLAGLIGPGEAHGLETALSGRASVHTAVALTDVVAFTTDGSRLRRLAGERPGLALALAAAVAGRTIQAQDELACQAHHRIEQRLARLLLGLRARQDDEGLLITQDELSQMLAVQRTTVTMLAHRLKAARLVAYGRGRIRILDREGLERLACGCPPP